jgi:glycosyltransferase involved in cell wall biosynthesis
MEDLTDKSHAPIRFDKKIIIVTPWFDDFVGGAGSLAKGMARELSRRGVETTVFTTCSLSPYDSWWEDHYAPGVYQVEGVETRRFATNRVRSPYDAVIEKIRKGMNLTSEEEEDFFKYSINSTALIDALEEMLDDNHEIVALPYFQGLTYSVVSKYPRKVSLIPCFHDEPQFYWSTTKNLLANAKHVFYNSHEEKAMTIRQYGRILGRRIVEGVVTGVGVELPSIEGADEKGPDLPANHFVYAGRKETGKNVPLLCDWFAEYIRQSASDAKLVFIGGGDRRLVPRSNYFLDLGVVSEAQKRNAIRGSRGLINLSRNESFSIVLMEAWLQRVPVIVHAGCAVTKGHVERSNGGLFAENCDEFTLCLKYLQDHPEVSEALGANGHRYVSANFSFDSVLAKYLGTLLDPESQPRGSSSLLIPPAQYSS